MVANALLLYYGWQAANYFLIDRRQSDTLTILHTDRDYLDMTAELANEAVRFQGDVWIISFGTVWPCKDMLIETLPGVKCFTQAELGIDSGFERVIDRRIATVVHALEHTNYKGVMVLDSDVALFRNVAARAERLGDLVFQQEAPCADEKCVNGGVWWARGGAPDIVKFLNRVQDRMRALNLHDQDAFQLLLSDGKADALPFQVNYFDWPTHPNGFLLATDKTLVRRKLHLAHANWCVGGRGCKRERLEQVRQHEHGIHYEEFAKFTANNTYRVQIIDLMCHRIIPDLFWPRTPQSGPTIKMSDFFDETWFWRNCAEKSSVQ